MIKQLRNSLLINIIKRFYILFLLIFGFYCAVQEPPSGGEDDTTPPKVVEIYPPNNTVNFKDNKIRITFDEYVDRRSFREALFISPRPKGDIILNWSGKEVEIEFSTPLEKNRTYVFTIGKLLKDVNRGNPITEPISFAISTGATIDEGKISGRVFDFSFVPSKSEVYRNLVVTAYKIINQDINPEFLQPDFVCPVAPNGEFSFTNLPYGKYRLFAIVDNDRDYLYTPDFDNIAITNDIFLSMDSSNITGINFLLDLDPKYTTEYCLSLWGSQNIIFKGANTNARWLINQLNLDSLGNVAFSYSNGAENLPVIPSILTYLKHQKIPKLDLISGTKLINNSDNSKVLLNFYWVSDTILNIRPQENLNYFISYTLEIQIDNKVHNLKFKTAPIRKFGNLKGNIYGNYQKKVIVYLVNNENSLIYHRGVFDLNSIYGFDNILEGKYTLFAFVDENEDGVYNRGNYFPYSMCEPFFMNPELLVVQGNWTLENVNISF
ncbi:MAG: Ig-like domain-containing protein [Ignavibacteria bacterium]|nr:Ig-like domain-containing protein [Ignavibacteria bacterium]